MTPEPDRPKPPDDRDDDVFQGLPAADRLPFVVPAGPLMMLTAADRDSAPPTRGRARRLAEQW